MGLISKRVINLVAENAKKTNDAKAVRRLMKLDNMTDEDLTYLASVMAEIKDTQEMYYVLFQKKLPAKALNIIMEVIIPNVSINNLGEILTSNRFASNLSDLSQENVKLFMDRANDSVNIKLKRLIKEKLPNVPDSFGLQPIKESLKTGYLDEIAERLKNMTYTKEEYCETVDYLLYAADSSRGYLISQCLEICLYKDCLPAEKKMEILLYFLSKGDSDYIENYFKSLKFTEESKSAYVEQLFKTQNISLLLIFSQVVKLTKSEISKLVDMIVETEDDAYSHSIKRIMLRNNMSEESLKKCVDWMKQYGDPEDVCECLTGSKDYPYYENIINNEEQFLSLLEDLITLDNAEYLIDVIYKKGDHHKIPAKMLDRIVDMVIMAHENGWVRLNGVASLPYFEQLSSKQKKKLVEYVVSQLLEGRNSTKSGLEIVEYDCDGDYYQLFKFAEKFSNLLTNDEKQKIATILLHDWQMGCYEVKNYLLKESMNYSEEFIDELTAHAVSVLDDYFYNSYMEILPKLQDNAIKADKQLQNK